MRLQFTKMQGLGNDFVVIEALYKKLKLTPRQLRYLSDRHFGIGCDQILFVEKPQTKKADFRYRIFNADGGEVEQCGNGARCFMRFVREKKLSQKKHLVVETKKGLITLSLQGKYQVRVDMGRPDFTPAHIPFITDSSAVVQPLEIAGKKIAITVLSMGNPHAVILVKNVDTTPVSEQGPLIEKHPRFPRGVNVGFMQIISRHHIKLRVYERGVGETLACGSGACAAVVAGICRGLLAPTVRVTTRGGNLKIHWKQGAAVLMTGPATPVFEGIIDL